MHEISTIKTDFFDEIIDINREQGSFILKVMETRERDSEAEFWLALYFHGKPSWTMRVDDDEFVHQNWELLGATTGEDKSTGEENYLYIFNFVGSPRHGTMKYDGKKLAVPFKALHGLMKEECDNEEGLAEKLNRTRGLEHLTITKLPNMSGHYIATKE